MLRSLRHRDKVSWLVMEDFNEIFLNNEKSGGQTHLERQVKDFWQAIREYEFKDLGFSENPFTWSNGREGENLVCERLD